VGVENEQRSSGSHRRFLPSLLVVLTTFTVGELYSQEVVGTMHEHAAGGVRSGESEVEKVAR
jgi:hypothetical protein